MNLDLIELSETLAAGARKPINLRPFFALVSGSGLQLRLKGQGGSFVNLPLNFVFGDGRAPLGDAEIYNPTGSPVTFRILTSSVGFNASALNNTQSIAITSCAVTLPVSGTVSGPDAEAAAPAGAPLRVAGWDGTNLRTLKTDANGNQVAVGPAASGAAVSGAPVRIAGSDGTTTRDILTTNGGLLRVALEASAGQTGQTLSRTRAAAGTNATSVKASAARLYSILVSNPSAAVRYLKIYAKASAPTVGTDTPVIVVLVPAGQTVSVNYGGLGMSISTGLAFAMTTGEADTDTGALTAGDLHLTLGYV